MLCEVAQMPFAYPLCLAVLLLLGGCAMFSNQVINVDGAHDVNDASASFISISTDQPAILRAVDEKMLPGIDVPNAFRSLAYVLEPGTRVLWLSSVPAGIPLVPQRIACYVLKATMIAGARYTLYIDPKTELAGLMREGGTEPPIMGQLVDNPFVFQRNCRWK